MRMMILITTKKLLGKLRAFFFWNFKVQREIVDSNFILKSSNIPFMNRILQMYTLKCIIVGGRGGGGGVNPEI